MRCPYRRRPGQRAERRSGVSRDLPRVLCVDDEPQVLEGLSLHLRRRYHLLTAPGGTAALEILRAGEPIAVIVSDMRMPGMDGATFLKAARRLMPDATRVLLTGHAELDTAIAAVNEGQIFRFLSKPCPPSVLLETLEAAEAQNRLVTTERVLLEQTLAGSVRMLTDVLALTNPVSFGRATRIKQLVSDLADKLVLPDRWQVELAAMLSQLGTIILPGETAEKLHYGRPLTPQEQAMVARMPEVTEQLLGNVPRLDIVRDILARAGGKGRIADAAPDSAEDPVVAQGARLLRVALDFDALESNGKTAALAIDVLRGRPDHYSAAVLAALAAVRDPLGPREDIRELSISALRAGMSFADDVKLANGTLLVVRGYQITAGFMERVRNFSAGTIREPLRVVVNRTATATRPIAMSRP
jgi:response regulator RpfG family c-di-GMP phosphodiesterase